MEAKHTRGPWRVEPWDYPNRTPAQNDVPTIRNNADAVAQVLELWPHDGGKERTAERNANAYLIASAPELLLACEAALENLRLWEEAEEDDGFPASQMPSPLRDKLEGAIAAAKGES